MERGAGEEIHGSRVLEIQFLNMSSKGVGTFTLVELQQTEDSPHVNVSVGMEYFQKKFKMGAGVDPSTKHPHS